MTFWGKKFLRESFAYNAINIFGYKILCYIAGIFSSVYLAKILGPEGKGKLAVVTSVYGMVLQFGNMGMASAHTYYISKDRKQISKCEGNIILMTLFSAFIVSVGLPYFIAHQTLLNLEPFLLFVAFSLVPFSMLLMLQENLFVATNQIKYFNMLQVWDNSLYLLIIMIISFFLKLTIEIIVTCMLIAMALVSAYSLILYFRKVEKKVYIVPRYLLSILPYGIKSYCSCLVSYLVLRADVFMLNYFSNDYEVGIYSLAVNLVDMSYMVSSSISIILFPKLGTLKSIFEKKSLMKKIFLASTPILLFVYLFMGGLAPYLINILYGKQYMDTVQILQILIPGAFCWASSNYFFQFFSSENRFLPTVLIPVIALIVNIILNYYFIPMMGNRGAAFASTCSYTICLIGMVICYFYHTIVRIKERE